MRRIVLAFITALVLPGIAVASETTSPEVFLYGNPEPGPYLPELVGATVRLNGIQVYPRLARTQPIETEPTPQNAQRHAFVQQGWGLQRQLEQDGLSCDEITVALAAHYRSRPDLVTVVKEAKENCFIVRWRDGSEEEIIVVPSEPAQSPEESARAEYQLIRHLLGRGCIIIVSSSGNVYVPPDDAERLEVIRREIARARALPTKVFGTLEKGYRDAQWDGRYLAADIAAQFARPLDLTTIRNSEED